jgi:hypothetical protein
MIAEAEIHKKAASEDNAGGEKTINEWMEVFRTIYADVDSKRSPVDMWVAATSYFTKLGEAIRSMDFYNLMKSAAHAFCWMCSFMLACRRIKGSVFDLHESFSGMVTTKYPLVCGHCRENPCHCPPKEMDSEEDKAASYGKLLEIRQGLFDAPDKYTVSRWCSTFGKIYRQNVHILTLEAIGFHFLEEAGEEFSALRDLRQLERVLEKGIKGIDEGFVEKLATYESIVPLYHRYGGKKPEMDKADPENIMRRLVRAKMNMFIEFADTFSWFCSIINKVESIAQKCKDDSCGLTQNALLEKLIEVYLPAGTPACSSCRKCPCGCVFYD